jgi:flagellar protein FlaG
MITQASSSPPAVKTNGAAPAVAKVIAENGKPQAVQEDRQGNASPEALEAAVAKVAGYVQNVQRNLNFSVDEASGQTVVKVIDSDSEEVIRQIPSEEMLTLARHLAEMSNDELKGVLVQSRA